MSFQYRKLRSKHSIRVLDLYSLKKSPDPNLHGALRIVSLDDNPSFSSLSYTWQGSRPTNQASTPKITCSNETIEITQNCWDALFRLRELFGSLALWVDSICINQSDEDEKRSQIPLMREIYGKAKRVFIWLGEGNRNSDLAMDWLSETSRGLSPWLGVRFHQFPGNMKPREMMKLIHLLPEFAAANINRMMPRKDSSPYNPEVMNDIWSRQWFRRMWTIQELVMASEPWVICGSKTIRWNSLHWGIVAAKNIDEAWNNAEFRDVFYFVLSAEAFWLEMYRKTDWTELYVQKWLVGKDLEHASPIRRRIFAGLARYGTAASNLYFVLIFIIIITRYISGLRPLNSVPLALLAFSCAVTLVCTPPGQHEDMDKEVKRKIVRLLNQTRPRQATQPADKVFALFGMLQELQIPLEYLAPTDSIGEVYHKFTYAIIDYLGSLDLLVEASEPWLPDAPSWVPDWNRRHRRVCGASGNAAKNSSPNYRFRGGTNGELEVTGVIVDTVDFRTDQLQHPDGDTQSSKNLSNHVKASLHNIRILKRFIAHTRKLKRFQQNSSLSNVLFDVVHSELGLSAFDQEKVRPIFDVWYSYLSTDYSECTSLCTSDIATLLSLFSDAALAKYHKERCAGTVDRKVFITTSSGLIGAGPLFTHSGDVVALISGFNTPMILRRSGESFRVVGTAFVDAMMTGERWNNDPSTLETLVLI